MEVLVTAGTGFVGSHAVAALQVQDHEIRLLARVPDRAGKTLAALGMGDVEVVEGDVTDRRTVERAAAGCDAVLHAAGRFSFDVRETARGTLRWLAEEGHIVLPPSALTEGRG